MKYNLKHFNSAVNYYKKKLTPYKKKTILILMHLGDDNAYFSIAPLSRAAYMLGIDISVSVIGDDSEGLEALYDVWDTFDNLKKGVVNTKTKALKAFIAEVEKKTKGKFKKIFKRPDLEIFSDGQCFVSSKGLFMEFKTEWYKTHKWNNLLKTGKVIWSQVMDLKSSEKVGIGFELVPDAKHTELPLEDYLDSFSISLAMASSIKNSKSMKASTARWSMLDEAPRLGELSTTLLGCELKKNVSEPIFKKFKVLSRLLKLNRLKTNNASFFIHAKGYGGKHLFGEAIGYPTDNKKSRWPSPGGFIYKFDWYAQSAYEDRDPISRVCFTETLPIDIFIETCNIDWLAMKRRDDKIRSVVNKSDHVAVESKTSNFKVYLKSGKSHRLCKGSDVETRNLVNQDILKLKGIKTGTMANLPGGEAFVTPEYIDGIFYGDVVISVDRSYVLNPKQPLVVECSKKGYNILSGPKKILSKLDEKKAEAWKRLMVLEKNKSLPQPLINMKKKNFNNIGEFAINTNPQAKLCDYLIVNEKIAKMIHIALGAGFEPDKDTEYHYDIVINAQKQKLDIYGVKGSKRFYILKKGHFVV